MSIQSPLLSPIQPTLIKNWPRSNIPLMGGGVPGSPVAFFLKGTIDISISDAPNIDPNLWPIFFTIVDGVPTEKRADADIITSAFADPRLNEDTMIGNLTLEILLLYHKDTDSTTLSKARKYVKATVFFGAAIVGIKTEFGLPKAPDWYVDSVGGLDTNSGTSRSAPLKTITALLSKDIAANDLIGLAAGSYWRETFSFPADDVTIGAYGTGPAPVIDGADVVTGWVQDVTYTNCYKVYDTMPDDQVNVNQAVWEDGEPMNWVASAELCDSTPGSFYYTPITADVTYTVYIHPTGSTSPEENVYEISKRKYCIESTVEEDNVSALGPIVTKRGYANGGVLRLAGVNQYARQVDAYSESLHAVYLSQGAMVGIKTTASIIDSGANDIVFIQYPALIAPSTGKLTDFECNGVGNLLSQALLVHLDSLERVHYKNGLIKSYGEGGGGRNLKCEARIYENISMLDMRNKCIAGSGNAGSVDGVLYIVNSCFRTSGDNCVYMDNTKENSKLYIYGSYLEGDDIALYLYNNNAQVVHLQNCILATNSFYPLWSRLGTLPYLEINNCIFIGGEVAIRCSYATINYVGNNNIFFSTKIGTVNSTDIATLSAWQSLTSQDADSYHGDPLFVTDPRTAEALVVPSFAVQAGSQAKTLFAGIADKPASYTAPIWVDAEVAAMVNY